MGVGEGGEVWWGSIILFTRTTNIRNELGFICMRVMPGEPERGVMVPPTSPLGYIANSDLHKKALEHVEQLATVKVVWTVKINDAKEVTPCGLSLVIAKQMVCRPGVNVLS